MSQLPGVSGPDNIDDALAELEVFAAGAWSNNAIVERVQHIRQLRRVERMRASIWPQIVEAPDPDRIVVTPETRWP